MFHISERVLLKYFERTCSSGCIKTLVTLLRYIVDADERFLIVADRLFLLVLTYHISLVFFFCNSLTIVVCCLMKLQMALLTGTSIWNQKIYQKVRSTVIRVINDSKWDGIILTGLLEVQVIQLWEPHILSSWAILIQILMKSSA
jgi:hypothetical protein